MYRESSHHRMGGPFRAAAGLLLLVPTMLIGSGCICLKSCASMFGAPTATAPADESREKSVRPGINKKYESPDVDVWVGRFESDSRELARYRRRIAAAIGVKPGMVVADVGAGTGLFTPLLAESVGPKGKVFAVDIVPEFLALIRKRAKAQGLHNVETVLGKERSVALPPDSIDLAFLCDVYHHFEYPRTMLHSIRRALRPGGLLVVIDFDRVPGKSRQWVLDHVRAGRDVVASEIVAAGFTRLDEPNWTPYLEENYGMRFRKTE